MKRLTYGRMGDHKTCTTVVYMYWSAHSWMIALHFERPVATATRYWWRFWARKEIPRSLPWRLWKFFCFGVVDCIGVSWDIRKRWESEYTIAFLLGYLQISFDQKERIDG